MRQFSNVKKAQAIIFVLFILAVLGTVSGGLAVMWQSELQTRSSERDGLVAFYLAQAGVERAKIELANNEGWAGVGPVTLGAGTYTVTAAGILCPAGPYLTCRQITSTGSIASAQRQISLSVCVDSPPANPNIPGDESMLAWTWREI